MTNPTVDTRFTRVHSAPVMIGDHAIVGSNSIILPGVTLSEGVSIAALSLVKDDCDAFYIYGGIPARKLKPRSRNLLKLAEQLHIEEDL